MNNFDITKLESAIKGILLNGNVSSTVWNNRPKTADTSKSDFVVASVEASISDEAAYGATTLYVSLFAKDGGGFKNGVKLSLMYQRLLACMPASLDITENNQVVASYEIDTNPTILPDVGDDYGFHCRIIQFSIIIKVL